MKIESILTILFITFLIFKYFQLPGSNIIMVTFLISVSILYVFLSFYLFCDEKIQQQNLIFSILSGICISFAPVAILFKIMNWDNGNFYIFIGILLAVLIYIISYFLKSKAPDHLKNYYKNMLLRTGILTLLQLFCILL